MLPLGLLTPEDKAEVVEIISGRQMCIRVEDMGLRTGKIVEVLSNDGRGPLLLRVDESRIAIGRGLAMKIMVRRKE